MQDSSLVTSTVPSYATLPAAEQIQLGRAMEGRVVLVVGACGAHGRAVARVAAKAGATVVLAGRRVPALEQLYDELKAFGQEPAIYPFNLEGAHPDDYHALGERMTESLGGLHGLVFAAGRLHGLSGIEHIDGEEWLRTWHVQVNAPFLLLRGCHTALAARSGTAVLYVDDPARVERALWGAYGVAQGALHALVRIAGDEAGRHGPKVAGLLCPPTAGPMMQRAYPARSMREFADPALTAPACLWLLADNARSGQIYDARVWASNARGAI